MAHGLFGSCGDSSKIDDFERKVILRLETRGGLDTISWLKSMRVSLYSYLAGNPVQYPYMSTDKDGLPKAFKGLRPGIRSGDIGTIRLAMTLLQCSRVISEWKEPDLSTITTKPSFDSN
jgi:hypothetical protein